MPLRKLENTLLRDEQRATARTFALVIAIYYLLIALAHLAVLPPHKKPLMFGVALASASLAIIARFSLRSGGPKQTEAWMVALIGLVAVNITLHGVYVGDREQIYYLTTLLAAFPMLTPSARAAAAASMVLLTGSIILLTNHSPPLSVSLVFLLGAPAIGGLFAASRTRSQAEVLAGAQAEAHRLRKAAEQSEQAKTLFLANMSHEIRTPLNGVIGVSEVLAKTRLSAKQSEMVDLIRGSSETLERLLTDILDLSKIEAGKLHLESEPFDLEAEVDAAANLLRARATEKGLSFTISYEPGVGGTYLGDAVRLRQIVSNLVSNAVKFTDCGRIEVVVAYESESQPPQLKIVVQDTGPGFTAETLSRLFQRFEQADGSTTRLHGGTGLGLSIVKSLAEMQGGSVAVESVDGKGSRFEVNLPYPRGTIEKPLAPKPIEELSLQPREASLNILLAEDNPSNRKVVSIILEPFSVNLVIAEDGRQAVTSFRNQAFDLILMDMQMPTMDGLTATRLIRDLERTEGRRRTPIAMLSANALSTHRQEAEAAGCDIFIAKPIRPEALLKGLKAVLD